MTFVKNKKDGVFNGKNKHYVKKTEISEEYFIKRTGISLSGSKEGYPFNKIVGVFIKVEAYEYNDVFLFELKDFSNNLLSSKKISHKELMVELKLNGFDIKDVELDYDYLRDCLIDFFLLQYKKN